MASTGTATTTAAWRVTNAISALEYGADRVHGTGLGIGERVGNAAIDQLLLNLKLLGWLDHDLSKLVPYVQQGLAGLPRSRSRQLPARRARTRSAPPPACTPRPSSRPRRRGDAWLADRIYSGVPAGVFGSEQEIEIGHMSGMSNVHYWLEQARHPREEALCQEILRRAKTCHWTLTDEEILEVVAAHRLRPRGAVLKGKRLSS